MPLPLILGVGALAAVTAKVAIGASKVSKELNDNVKAGAKESLKSSIAQFDRLNYITTAKLDKLGVKEIEILAGFRTFQERWRRLQNTPAVEEIFKEPFIDLTYSPEKLDGISLGARLLRGGIDGAEAGTFGGFAVAGATKAAVLALDTDFGAAEVSAVLLALGETTTESTEKPEDALDKIKEANDTINKVCKYLETLCVVAENYLAVLAEVQEKYQKCFESLKKSIDRETDFAKFAVSDQANAENTVYLVGMLRKMCKVQLVLESQKADEPNIINQKEIDAATNLAKQLLRKF
ncbi:MAG: hypothetical protein FWG68_04075 [Defluviitaleaceae bacterium]|nr:hypothetical protein [Defluviitaleaceae bacterium]